MQKILEITWLILFVVLLGIAIKSMVYEGFLGSLGAVLLAALSFLLYLLRRNRRINNGK